MGKGSTKIEVIFLGTGTSQGVPVINCSSDVCFSDNPKDKRLRSSVLIRGKFGNILIDTTIDFRMQFLRENINKLDAILYTHEHVDHTGGLDDVRPLTYLKDEEGQIIEKKIPIYASENVIKHIKKAFYYIFENPDYPGIPKLCINKIDNNSFYFNKQKISPIMGLHGKLPVLGFRINDFAYLTDFNKIVESEYEKLNNLDVLVINCLRKNPPHHSHFVLEEVLKEIEKIKPKRTYFTHISHNFGFHDEIEKYLPENVFLSYDGLRLKL